MMARINMSFSAWIVTALSILLAPSAVGATSITIGETNILSAGDNGNANLLLAQNTTLAQPATIISLSFYVTTASGNLRMGIYDATGPGGNPGKLMAQTNGFKTVKGWNTANVVTPVLLPAGRYWLAYLPSSNGLAFVKGQSANSGLVYYNYNFGNLPATYSRSPTGDPTFHWSFYATLTPSSPPPPPPPPVTVNGACGSSSGTTLSSAPATNLCLAGTASTVSGAGPWSWSCLGSNGGTNASCSASLAVVPPPPVVINGACGSSNGATLSSAPTTNLCSAGTTSNVSGTGPWSWSCMGSNGGGTASCRASSTSPSSGLIPSDRITAWNPGLVAVGGIPNRTQTMCATVSASTYGNGATDASSGIQAAIDACPAGQLVMLGAGKFVVNNPVYINKGITLRGQGPGVTFLNKTNGAHPRSSPMQPVDPGSYAYDASPVIIVGPGRWPGYDNASAVNLTADAVKGANSVTVANASGFAAGQFVLLDETSGASWQPTPTGFGCTNSALTSPCPPLVWQGDRVAWNMHYPTQTYQDDNGASNASAPYDTTPGVPPAAMSWFSRTDRPTNEIKEIASVSGNTITFTTPMHISYRTSLLAQLVRATTTNPSMGNSIHVVGAGVENFTVLGGADGQIRFENAAYSWANAIESTQWIGEGFAVNGSFRIEIRGSYVHDGSWPEPGGAGYAISFAGGSSEILVEDNIIMNTCKIMVVRSSGAGSVFGYNYTDDSWDYDNPGWVEVGLNASHMAGPHHVLFEGNYSHNIDSDYTHGNAIYLTFFRNWLSGQRRSFADTANARAVGLAYGSWWDSVIGNVLGRAGQTAGWIYDAPPMSGNNANWTGNSLWEIGYDPERWGMYADPKTLLTLIRGGNFDYLTNQVHWESLAQQALPPSLYLSSKPGFFGNYPWPWVDPTGSTKIYTLPAKARYEAGTPFALAPGATTP